MCAIVAPVRRAAAISSGVTGTEKRAGSVGTPFTEQVTTTLSLDTGGRAAAPDKRRGCGRERTRAPRQRTPKPLTRARIPIPLKKCGECDNRGKMRAAPPDMADYNLKY